MLSLSAPNTPEPLSQAEPAGRLKETEILEKTLASEKPELVAVIGRRRVGKTYLVRTFFGSRIDFEMVGLKDGNMEQQLRNFTYSLKEAKGQKGPVEKAPKDWLAAFHELKEFLESPEKKNKRKVVFIDELPWAATAKSDFLTGFSYFWNSYASKSNIIVVICGSATAWMIKKIINNKGGLHNRVTRRILLQPFTLLETEAYFQSRDISFDRYQILQLYMTMGGIPHYLDQVEGGKTAVQNIDEICFHPLGLLRTEFDNYLEGIPKNEAGNWQSLNQSQSWKSWSGYAYENICLQHIEKIKAALGISGMHTRHCSFLAKATEEREGVQIDLLIDRMDNAISICEIKFYNDVFSLSKEQADKLRKKRRSFREASRSRKQLFLVLITTFGLAPNKHSLGLIDNVVTMGELF
ncbi:MAG: AAA family ATPase [Phaeodactylibacter sp.]|nr:AAA family ATPase [Phaeodactylibacter sp.]